MPKTPPLVHQLSRRQFVAASAATAVGAYAGLRGGLSIAADGTPPRPTATTYASVLQAAPEGPVGEVVPRNLLRAAEKAKTTPEAYLASIDPALEQRASGYLANLDETWTYQKRFADQSLEARQGAIDVALGVRDQLPDFGSHAPSGLERRHDDLPSGDVKRPPKPIEGDALWILALRDVLYFASSTPWIVADARTDENNPSTIAPDVF